MDHNELFILTKDPKKFLIHCISSGSNNQELQNEKISMIENLNREQVRRVLHLLMDPEGKRGLRYFTKYHDIKFHKVPGDGDCQFTSIAHQIYGDKKYSNLVRYQLTDYITKNPTEYEIFYAPGEDYETFGEWLDSMRYFEWGDEYTLKASSEFYDKPILVYNKTDKTCTYHIPQGQQQEGNLMLSDCPDELLPNTIILIYNGENHYDSITHKNKTVSYLHPSKEDISKMKTLTKDKKDREKYMFRDDSDDSDSDEGYVYSGYDYE